MSTKKKAPGVAPVVRAPVAVAPVVQRGAAGEGRRQGGSSGGGGGSSGGSFGGGRRRGEGRPGRGGIEGAASVRG